MKSHLLVSLLLLGGCTQYSIRNIDKPPSERYEIWKKSGVNILGVRKALLECGAIMPSWTVDGAYKKNNIINQNDQMNHSFLTDRCMINAGFIEQNTSWTLKDACADVRYRDYPACKPDAVIPTPSAERRLNSWYCKVKSDYDYCLKHAIAPRLCSPEKTNNPPPECLPPGQEYKSSPAQLEQKSGTEAHVPMKDFPEKSLKLQQDMQRDSGRQMDKLLRNTAPKTGR